MSNRRDHDLSPDLELIGDQLRRDRPEATAVELDRIKLDARARAAQPSPYRLRGPVLKSRFAIAMILVLGIAFSGTGGALAVTGTSSSGNAAGAQYVKPSDNSGTLGSLNTNDPSGQAQSVGAGKKLPFTGWAPVPLLVIGVMLLSGGFLLYRRSSLQRD